MTRRRLQTLLTHILGTAIAWPVLAGVAAPAQEKNTSGPQRLPQKVMNTLTAKFRNPQIQKWTREQESGTVLYDIEFRQDGDKLEADIKEDGSILNWEKQIPVTDLPAAAAKAVHARYPDSSIKEVMRTTVVQGGKDVPEGFEVVLRTANGKTIEMTVAPDGKVLEDPGAGRR